MGIPPHIYILSKMNLVLTKQDEMVKQVVEALSLELDDHNIVGGYNTVKLMHFSRHNRIGW